MYDSFFRTEPSELRLISEFLLKSREISDNLLKSVALYNMSEFKNKLGCYVIALANSEHNGMSSRTRFFRFEISGLKSEIGS